MSSCCCKWCEWWWWWWCALTAAAAAAWTCAGAAAAAGPGAWPGAGEGKYGCCWLGFSITAAAAAAAAAAAVEACCCTGCTAAAEPGCWRWCWPGWWWWWRWAGGGRWGSWWWWCGWCAATAAVPPLYAAIIFAALEAVVPHRAIHSLNSPKWEVEKQNKEANEMEREAAKMSNSHLAVIEPNDWWNQSINVRHTSRWVWKGVILTTLQLWSDLLRRIFCVMRSRLAKWQSRTSKKPLAEDKQKKSKKGERV